MILWIVTKEEGGNHTVQWIIGLWSQNQPIHSIYYLLEGDGWGIVSIKDRMANSSLTVHIAVINWSNESHLWSSEWVVIRELDVEKEESSLIWSLLGAKEKNLPQIHLRAGEYSYEWMRLFLIGLELFDHPL